MWKRLDLAKTLLKDTGIIFIHIDENEFSQLKLLCDDVFDEKNLLGTFIWKARSGKGGTDDKIAMQHEYIYCYARDYQKALITTDKRVGKKRKEQLRQWGQGDRREDRESMFYPIFTPEGEEVLPIKDDGSEGRWRVGKKTMAKLIEKGEVVFEKNNNRIQAYRIYPKGNITETAVSSFILDKGTASTGTTELKQIFGEKVFETTKPISLEEYLLELSTSNNKEAIVLDFFAGSGTTGISLFELNEKDSGHRQFILATNNENNIMTEVCYPRIKSIMKGYAYTGKDKKVLLEKKITLTEFKKSEETLEEIEQIKSSNELLKKWDTISTSIKDGILQVVGEREIKGKMPGKGNSLKYYKTDFVGENKVLDASDDDKIELAHHCGEMLSIAENTLYLVEKDDYQQLFQNDNKFTAVYFREDLSKFDEFVKKVGKLKRDTVVYVFSWSTQEFVEEFSHLDHVQVKTIPQPILEIYNQIYNLG